MTATARTEAEGGLRFQAQLLDAVPQAVIATDLNGTIRYWNAFAERLYGWSGDEAVGRSVLDLAPAGRMEARAAEVFERLKKGELWAGEFEVRRRDGTTFWASVIGSPIHDTNGRLVGVISASTDVTETHEAHEALRASEERFRALVEHSGVGVWQLDPDGLTAYVNPAMCAMLEVTDAETLAGTSYETFFTRESVVVVRRELAKRALGIASTYEATLVGAEGTERQVLISGAPVEAPDGTLIGRMGAIVDLTERTRLEEQLAQAQKMESIGRLAGGVAHDFNNVLTAILGNAHLLLEDMPKSSGQRRDVEEIRAAARRAAGLTSQLLAFSRKQVLVPQVLDLNGLVRETEKMLRRLIGEDIDLVATLDPSLGAITADPGQLQQIVLNLAVNARDAMPQGGKLAISTENVELDPSYLEGSPDVEPGPYVMLAVSDTGTGISADTKAHLFEPFFTTKPQGKGTGLGLATVYGIVKQSGGHIWVYSEPGHGSTFKVYFPRRGDDAVPERVTLRPSVSVRGTETVLLVEDDQAVRTLTGRVLASFGYHVLEAASGQEAEPLCAGRDCAAHLLLTDVVMPGESGRQLANRLRTCWPELRVLFMSGYTGDAMANHGVLDYGAAFIQKPFSPLALAMKVREVLDSPGPNTNRN